MTSQPGHPFPWLSFVISMTVWVLCIYFVKTSRKTTNGEDRPKKVVLISMDGFRWDFLNGRARTPVFDALKMRGVHARRGMTSSIPTNTLPNHITLVTGLYPGSHGFIDNAVYDQKIGSAYKPIFYEPEAYNDPEWYRDLEPVWVTNQIQRSDGRSGVLMWMTGHVSLQGILPHRYIRQTNEMDEMTGMGHLVNWLTDETQPINLAVAYFNEPDVLAHRHGPESRQVTDKIEDLDKAMGFLVDQLDKSGLASVTDVIVLSDHGFVTISQEQMINLDDILESDWYRVYAHMPAGSIVIYPEQGCHDLVYSKLKKAADMGGRFSVYNSHNIPERFHLRNHPRVPIFAMAYLNYTFVSNREVDKYHFSHGDHGFDNMEPLMNTMFLAFGPSFKEGESIESFRNVDVYPLMCHLLGLEPKPNNGSLEAASHLLRSDS